MASHWPSCDRFSLAGLLPPPAGIVKAKGVRTSKVFSHLVESPVVESGRA